MMKLRSVAYGLSALFIAATIAQAQSPRGPNHDGYRPGPSNRPGSGGQFDPRHQQDQRPVPDSRYLPGSDRDRGPSYRPGDAHPAASPVATPASHAYRFGQRGHLARLAAGLERRANEVCWEMHANYRQARNWDETYRVMYQILQDAKHIRQLVREEYRGADNKDHIADDLHNMDRHFDRIQRRVARWEPDRVPRNVPVADVRDLRDPRNSRSTPDTELRQRMQRFDDTLGHLMVDYGVRTQLQERATGRFDFRQTDAPPPR